MQTFGRFLLYEQLGSGGMATVFRADRMGPAGFRRTVALKRIHGTGLDPAARVHLLREARIGGALRHPNLVDTFEVGEVDGELFIAMSLVDGPTASDVRRQVGPLPARATLEVALQVASGLAYLHGHGIVHRDIKPSNLLFDPVGRVRIADLGVATVSRDLDDRAGTPAYMAPERFDGRDGPEGDVFALGVVLVELVTARRVLRRRSVPALLLALDQLESRRAEVARPVAVLDPALGDAVERMLAADPATRPTAAEVVALLETRTASGPGLAEILGDVRRARPSAEAEPSDGSTPLPTQRRTNLPPRAGRFVGRAVALAHLESALDHGKRLVTLRGPGGVGKTRLALRLGELHLSRWPGGVWWADLSGARTLPQVVACVAGPLGVGLVGTDDATLVQQITDAVALRGRCLWLLDNAEQVVDAVTQVLDAWLDQTTATVVVTSRARLGLPAEEVVVVRPLREDDAIALFAGRVEGLEGAEPDVRALVARLDGMPLALELVAGRLAELPLSERAAALRAQVQGPEVHVDAVIQATLQWSWDLLPGWGRSALRQLSLFEGAFSIELAEALLELSDGAPEVVDALGQLADRSMVEVVRGGRDARFALLASVRSFAATALSAAGDLDTVSERFARSLALRYPFPSRFGGDPERRARLLLDLPNVHAAARRAMQAGALDQVAHLVRIDAQLRSSVGPLGIGLDLIEELAPQLQTDDQRYHVALAESQLAYAAGDNIRATQAAERALPLALDDGDLLRIHDAHAVAANAAIDLRELEVCERHQLAALRCAERLSPGTVATAKGNLGNLRLLQGRPVEAERCLLAAKAYHERVGDERAAAVVTLNTAVLYSHLGRSADCSHALGDALRHARRAGTRKIEALALYNLGVSSVQVHDHDLAERYIREATEVATELGSRRTLAMVIGLQAATRIAAGHGDEADAILAQAELVAGDDPVLHNVLRAQAASAWGQAGDHARGVQELRRVVAGLKDVRSRSVYEAVLAYDLQQTGALDEAGALLTRVVPALRETGDRASLAGALALQAWAARRRGEPGHALLDEARTLASELDLDARRQNARWIARAEAQSPTERG